ncbi:hypothetical protein [Neomoorella mulderi]|uniref:hypothetical protein n=1 Tax=Neomoorella mulderi TaxID=202604 RepID=UPI000783BEF5|nr:hypothetical protein [Moorella mulderi]
MWRSVRPLSRRTASAILLGSAILLNPGIPLAQGFYFLLLHYILTFLLLIMIAHFFMCVHLTSLFEITKSRSDSYVLHLRPMGFIITAWRLGRSPKKVALRLGSDFIAAIALARRYIQSSETAFKVETWIMNTSIQKRLEKAGASITPIRFPPYRRIFSGLLAFCAYGNWEVWRKIKEAQYYRIAWTGVLILKNPG